MPTWICEECGGHFKEHNQAHKCNTNNDPGDSQPVCEKCKEYKHDCRCAEIFKDGEIS